MSRPNPLWNSRGGLPSSSKWSLITQYARASSRRCGSRNPRKHERRAERPVVHRAVVGRADAPFGPPDGKAVHAVPPQRGPHVQREVAVGVRADEVQRHVVPRGVRGERLDPLSGGRGGAADAQPRVDRLDRPRRLLVQPQVLGHRAWPEHGQVRFVPYLERPPRHLVDAVPLHQVAGEGGDQLPPLGPVRGRRDDAAVGEHGLQRVAGQRGGHEGQLDDRAQAVAEQPVVDGVDPAEIEVQRAGGVPAHHRVVVVQDGVRADHGGAELVVRQPERVRELRGDLLARVALGPALVRSEQQLGEPLGADHPPHPVERSGDRRGVHADQDRAGVAWPGGRLDRRRP